ncbi:hypothetical protein ACNQF7_03870 [Flavobacterium sp. RSP29]|uniref:hypothetical protein n=1 Tax=Flavobacterium sp. RSP29 TaxID=3401731 RepID=UPI003AAA50ED
MDPFICQKLKKITIRFENTSGKSLFLKGLYSDEKVTILESQSSALLNTFATANALFFLPYDVMHIEKNQEVMIFPID